MAEHSPSKPVPSTDRPTPRQPYAWLRGLILVMTLVAIGIGVLGLYYVEHRLVATAGESLALTATEIADKLDRLLFERFGDAKMLARIFASRPNDVAYMTGYLSWMQKSYPAYLWLGVVDREGRIVAASNSASVGQDLSKRPWFQAVLAGEPVHVGDVEPYEAAGGVDAVSFTTPIKGTQGEFLGAVTTRVALPALEEVLTRTIRTVQAQPGLLGTVEYQFLTRDGVAFVDSDLLHKGNVNLKHLGLPSALLTGSGKPGYVEEEHLRRHVQVVTGYAATQGYGAYRGLQWGILVRIDRSDILAPIREVLWRLVVIGAVIWGPMFLVLFWATGRLGHEWAQAQQESAHATAAEATLRESEERTRSIVETALDAVITADSKGVITDWNRRAETIFGWSREEAIGQPLATTLIPSHHRAAYEQGLRHFLATGESPALNRRIEMTACKRDGHEFPVEVAVSAQRLRGSYIFSGFVRDITERKRAERRLASQYAVTRVLSEFSLLEDASAKILQAICESLDWELGAFWIVDQQANVLRCIEIWYAPERNLAEFAKISRDRTFSPGIGLPGRVWVSGEPTWIRDVVKDANFPRAPFANQVGLHGAFGSPIRVGGTVYGVIEFFSHEIREPDADLLQMLADIGLKVGHFIERKHLEAQFLQAQKMEAIGQLAGGIAHDFNNLLTIIKGFSQVLLEQLKPGQAMYSDVEEIIKAGARANTLTKQLLAFSRKHVSEQVVLNLNDLIAETNQMFRRLLREDMKLTTKTPPDVGQVKVDPSQLEQVIMNLVVNALDAMPNGGQLTIETANVDLDDTYAALHASVRPGRYVMLSVSDTGCGMDAATQARIFEPFFTTKSQGKGTGLGLSTVYGIVNQSGGHVWVYSEVGRGTTFKVYLPRVDARVDATPVAERSGALPRGTETVLLSEDEPGVRALVRKILIKQGYTVLEARNGHEAWLINGQHEGPIHLLVTDVVMPEMNGRDLAARVMAVRSGIKVLFVSGYSNDAIVQQSEVQSGIAFLQKPFSPATLARKVRQVLDTSG